MAFPRSAHAFLVAILAIFASTSSPKAQSAEEEIITFPSLSMTDAQFLKGDTASAAPVTLTALLQLPTSAAETRFPAVIMLHGSGGSRGTVTGNWANVLNRMGVAVLRVDSYSARGFEEIYTDQGRVGEFNNIVDAFRAVDQLATHPRIDPARIAVMGFSRGGIGALYSSMTRFQDLYGPKKAKLVAHLPFYPPCNFALDGELQVGPAPIRAFHGEADVWNPLPRCRDYIERLKSAGHNAAIAIYPDAHHNFDNPGGPAYRVVDDAQTSRRCFRREEQGTLINADTGKAFSWKDDCVEMGPAVQFNAAAYDAAEKAVKAFLSEILGLR